MDSPTSSHMGHCWGCCVAPSYRHCLTRHRVIDGERAVGACATPQMVMTKRQLNHFLSGGSWNGGNPKSFKIRQFYYWHPRLWWSHHFRKPHKIKKKRKGNQHQKNVYNPHIRNDSLKYCPFSIMFMQWFRIAPRWWWRLVDYRWVYHIALVIQLAANAANPMKHVDLVNSLHGTRGAES